jgi:hypothetical protein
VASSTCRTAKKIRFMCSQKRNCPQSQFTHSCFCERFIYSLNQSSVISHRSAASSSRLSGADFLPSFTRGGSRGGGRGGGRGRFPVNFNKMSNSSGYDSRYAKSDPRRSGGDRSGNSSSGGGYGSRYNSGSVGGGGGYSRN